jgi:uncharacterized membrane protein YkvA (DUF1232 family)
VSWLWALGIGAAVLVGMWALFFLLAVTLPEGRWRDYAAFLPDVVTTARRLRRDPRVPRRVKIVLAVAAAWVISPIDLIPEFLPVVGELDDVIVVVLAFRYARDRIPLAALDEACPQDARLLRKWLGLSS